MKFEFFASIIQAHSGKAFDADNPDHMQWVYDEVPFFIFTIVWFSLLNSLLLIYPFVLLIQVMFLSYRP